MRSHRNQTAPQETRDQAHPPTSLPPLALPLGGEPERSRGAATAGAETSAPDDDVLDVRGVVRMLRVGRNKVYEMVARNEIPHRRFGRGIRFSRTAIMRWLDSWSPRIAKEGQ